ncbi:hypothetical protein [Salinigranum halophilum]|nr:hypothetical protein [Salinigranum halophilum]
MTLEPSGWFLFGLGLTGVGLVVWARDGYPGVTDVLVPFVVARGSKRNR